MLLEDATSKIQVQRALEAGDEELREDIQEQLDESMRWWDTHGLDRWLQPSEEQINVREIVTDDAFIDWVIEESPTAYDLTNLPRDDVATALRWAVTRSIAGRNKYGPFYVDSTRDTFAYKVGRTDSATFPESKLPDNAEYIPVEQAREFWASLDGHVTWDQTDRVEENDGWGAGDPAYICASDEEFLEWCRDTVAEYVQTQIKKYPAEAKEIFLKGVEFENINLGNKLRAANLPDEELLDFASKWFEGEDEREAILATIEGYFAALEGGIDEPREIIGEWTQADLRAMGITKGPLYEEAPWKLIKLHPGDLRLEGALQRHCVGDNGMGYIKALKDGEIEVWSLRSRANKPRFTLEIDGAFYDVKDDASDPTSPADYRGQAVKQLKGKANRTPGYAAARMTEIKFPDEIVFWDHALRELDVDPQAVDDFEAVHGVRAANGLPGAIEALNRNPSDACTGFDLPYRPR